MIDGRCLMVNEGVDEMSMSGSIELQGQEEFHQQGQRAKHNKGPEEETLYKKDMQLPIDRPRRLLC